MARSPSKPKGLGEHIKRLKEMHGRRVEIGWFESARSAEGIPMAQIASWNENGHVTKLKNGAIFITPPRPFMSNAATDSRKKIHALNNLIAGKIIDGRMDADKALAYVGEFFVGEIVMSIKSGSYAPNSDITVNGTKINKDGTQFIKGKGFNRPLINTAAMWHSATYMVY